MQCLVAHVSLSFRGAFFCQIYIFGQATLLIQTLIGLVAGTNQMQRLSSPGEQRTVHCTVHCSVRKCRAGRRLSNE